MFIPASVLRGTICSSGCQTIVGCVHCKILYPILYPIPIHPCLTLSQCLLTLVRFQFVISAYFCSNTDENTYPLNSEIDLT